MYGNKLYGTSLYGDDKYLNIEELEKCRPKLMPYLPEYYQKSNITINIQEAIEKELGVYLCNLDDFYRQLFISTATWGLNIYERELGLLTNTALTFEERREIITAKLRGRGTTTKEMIKNTAESFSGGEVDVIEDNPNYKFTIKFIGTVGIPRNMKSFIEMLETIKPAHLAYDFKYTWAICQWFIDMKMTCDEMKELTCNEVKSYERKVG